MFSLSQVDVLHTNLSIKGSMYIGQLNRNNRKKCLLVTSMDKILETHLQRSSVFLKAVSCNFAVYQKAPSSQLFFKDFDLSRVKTKKNMKAFIIN